MRGWRSSCVVRIPIRRTFHEHRGGGWVVDAWVDRRIASPDLPRAAMASQVRHHAITSLVPGPFAPFVIDHDFIVA